MSNWINTFISPKNYNERGKQNENKKDSSTGCSCYDD